MSGSGKISSSPDCAGGALATERSSTLSIGVRSLMSEGLTGQMPATPGRLLDILKEQLSRCRVMVNDSGLATGPNKDGTFTVYSTLFKNLKGAWKLEIGDSVFFLGRTRSNWILLYDRPPESYYEDARFMGVDLKRRDVLVLENGKTRFLSRVSRSEIAIMQGANSIRQMAKPAPDTIAPFPDGSVSYDGLKAKLKSSRNIQSDDLLFDMGEFAEGIKFITTLEDPSGGIHYYVVSGADEHSYWLYVNNAAQPPGRVLFTTRFNFKNDECFLYRED